MNRFFNVYVILPTLLLLSMGFQACQPTGEGQQNVYREVDLGRVAPEMSDRVFENDFVQASIISIPFKEEFPTHTAGDRLIFALNKFEIESQTDKGSSTKIYEAGEVNKFSSGKYSFKNVGINPIRFLSISRNETAALEPSNSNGLTNGITMVAPSQAAILMEDDQTRMVEVELAPGASIPAHDALPRMVYTLNSSYIKFLRPIEGAQKFWATRGSQGEIIWLEAGQYEIVNTSSMKPAKFILVGFKK